MSTKAHPNYGGAPAPEEWKLRLYVTDWTPRCVAAFRNLQKICQEHVGNKCNIEVVDLLEQPEVARRDQIVAVPTLVKVSPRPQRLLVGDFSKVDRVLKGLDVEPKDQGGDNTALISFRNHRPDTGSSIVYIGSTGDKPGIGRLSPVTGEEGTGFGRRSGGPDGQ